VRRPPQPLKGLSERPLEHSAGINPRNALSSAVYLTPPSRTVRAPPVDCALCSSARTARHARCKVRRAAAELFIPRSPADAALSNTCMNARVALRSPRRTHRPPGVPTLVAALIAAAVVLARLRSVRTPIDEVIAVMHQSHSAEFWPIYPPPPCPTVTKSVWAVIAEWLLATYETGISSGRFRERGGSLPPRCGAPISNGRHRFCLGHNSNPKHHVLASSNRVTLQKSEIGIHVNHVAGRESTLVFAVRRVWLRRRRWRGLRRSIGQSAGFEQSRP